MKNLSADTYKTIIFFGVFVIIALYVSGMVASYQKYTFEKPEAYASVKFKEIAYIDTGRYYSRLMFINPDGSDQTASDIFIPTGDGITLFGERLYEKGAGNYNEYTYPVWSPDGKTIGVMFTVDYSEPHFPILIRENGEILSCLQDPYLATDYRWPIQIIDDGRILINIKDKNDPNYDRYDADRYISLYNMRDCMEEEVFYNGEDEEKFSVSSKMWLAVIEHENYNFFVFDEKRNLIYTDEDYRNYYDLAWSKDGNKLAYVAANDYNTDFVIVYDFQTNEKTVLEFEGGVTGFSMSPDGEQLIYEIFYPDYELVNFDITTREITHLSYGSYPAWRP